MKLTLNQDEIEVALKQYVGANVSFKAGADIKIEFTAGRGEKGLTAEIDIPYLGVSAIPAAAPNVTKRSSDTPKVTTLTASTPKAPTPEDAPSPDTAGAGTAAEAEDAEVATETPASTTQGKSLFGAD